MADGAPRHPLHIDVVARCCEVNRSMGFKHPDRRPRGLGRALCCEVNRSMGFKGKEVEHHAAVRRVSGIIEAASRAWHVGATGGGT